MNKNVGKYDRYFRFALGVFLIAAGFYFSSWWGAIGLIPLATAFMSWCPLYSVLRMSSCKLFSDSDTCQASSASPASGTQ